MLNRPTEAVSTSVCGGSIYKGNLTISGFWIYFWCIILNYSGQARHVRPSPVDLWLTEKSTLSLYWFLSSRNFRNPSQYDRSRAFSTISQHLEFLQTWNLWWEVKFKIVLLSDCFQENQVKKCSKKQYKMHFLALCA